MKLHFENNLDYQLKAIESVTNLFLGQENNLTEFTLSKQSTSTQPLPGVKESTLGTSNFLQISENKMLENLKNIQLKNGLKPANALLSKNFTIEMETGTGKTYVYLRTIFELNKLYGFTKFIIVVPSIAIKEGVYKNLEITREHFENLYPNAKGYEYFLYDSINLGQVRNFATNGNIQIMVITVGAINKQDVNNLYKDNEKTDGEKPIDLIKKINPIIIVDEPQSVDGGLKGQGKKALEGMNSLCTIRYSATHVEKYHMVYKLDAIDAYEKELVKQIEVASLSIEDSYNRPYIKLISTHSKRSALSAKVEIDIDIGNAVKRTIITVEDGDDLEKETGRTIYKNYKIGTITCDKKNQSIELRTPKGEFILHPTEEYGGINADELKRHMIRRTIQEHLDKEIHFKNENLKIKVLSLFFIDSVKFYRQYDENKNSIKGKYAKIFEEEYKKFSSQKKYESLFKNINLDKDINNIHNGYFSIDKKGGWTDTSETNQSNRENAERAYNLIMKDKEKLLNPKSKLKFIFSHSALKEGWDNPNVFQICALREMGTERERRQTIGRGLRLCVDENGKRLKGFNINTLTIIARENYEEFAENLQKEIENETGIKFGIIEKHQFATIVIEDEKGKSSLFGVGNSENIWNYLKENNYINNNGKILDKLRYELKENQFDLPEKYKNQLYDIKEILYKFSGRLDIKNANERIIIKTRKAIFASPEFKSLWNRIKHKTTYRMSFIKDDLIEKCANTIKELPPITKTQIQFKKGLLKIEKSKIETKKTDESIYSKIDENYTELPDILTILENKTNLTRHSLVEILLKSNRLNDFKRNPQQFIEFAIEAINRIKQSILIDGIRYQLVKNGDYYAQELFEKEELMGYLKNTLLTKKSVYEQVVYDSTGIEKKFAEDLEINEAVKLYVKLPKWFKIPTPLGNYSPDWAILIEINNQEKLYFVVETKGDKENLRFSEYAKIKCGKKHFEELEKGNKNPAEYIIAENINDMIKHIKKDN